MTRLLAIAALSCLLLASCLRFDTDSDEQESLGDAVRISSFDAVVLCPLAALTEVDGGVSIVWAGYPPADDRLQLLHARVTSTGELAQAPRPVAELDTEIDGLALHQGAEGLEVQLTQRGELSVVVIEDAHSGSELPTHLAKVSETCHARVHTEDAELRVFLGQADGDLALFVAHEAL